MNRSLFLLLLAIVLGNPSIAQKNFKTEYQTFRFGLFELLDADNPMKVSDALAKYVQTFLDSHASQIPVFREHELREYERDGVEDKDEYRPVAKEELQKIRGQSLLIMSKEELVRMFVKENEDKKPREVKDHFKDNKDLDNLSVMLQFQSVSPLEFVSIANSQILTQLIFDKFPSEMVGKIYGRLGITGMYISTERKNKATWHVKINSYYAVNTYSVDVNTGDVQLVEVAVRER